MSRDILLCTLLLILAPNVQATIHPQIPSLASFTESNAPGFLFSTSARIVVDSNHQESGAPGPSLLSYAETFRQDLIWLTGFTSVPEVTTGSDGAVSASPSIFLTLGASNHTYFNGVPTQEGYDFLINEKAYIIKGSGALGVWWGTRSLLQQLALNCAANGSCTIPAGSGSDAPGWEVRGFMLDAARHWFELPFLADLCIYASFFKIQSFHLHASDNIWDQNIISGPNWRDLYSAFRFQPAAGSPIAGIVELKNETWTKEGFAALQETCVAHGVTIVPEVDTPGHSLVFSKWKPQLMIANVPDQLNLSYPDTIPTIKAVWDEVSIGADEYETSLADVYISFVNEMSDYIAAKSGKSIRIWGTYEPSSSMSISKNITIQHWDFPGDSIPVELMQQGYRVINSEQTFLYLDGKTSDAGQFPVELDQTLMWSGAPGGGGWAPNIFTRDDPSNNTDPANPFLRGSIMALWNDWGNNATTPLEIYYQLARSLAPAPGQNLNRAVKPPHANNIIFDYPTVAEPTVTPFDSVGPPYTLSFTIQPSPNASGIILAGNDSILHVESLAFEDPSTGVHYPLASYPGLPVDKPTAVFWWMTDLDIWGEYMKSANMSFAAPSRFVAAGLRSVSLRVS
ncbi:glycoside hydrolase [Roridomyces roridus]|uniref:beta-N-acetylhexosaminidase n=1 Tax=Roridomyces roridus TaxID=1738132 RepID=A0AAD7C2H5_9AGAR|nr:glycoside hydrolase [Roridomyces roridus]